MSKTCKDCHFLAKEHREEDGRSHSFSLSSEERERPDSIRPLYSLKCHKGVWDQGVGPLPPEKVAAEIDRPGRESGCFFFPRRDSMLFGADDELQRRAAEHERARRSMLLTQLGLLIAAAGLLANLVLAVIRAK